MPRRVGPTANSYYVQPRRQGWAARPVVISRPHSALGYLTPAAYAANLTATDDRLRKPDQLRRSSVAPPALLRQSDPKTLANAG